MKIFLVASLLLSAIDKADASQYAEKEVLLYLKKDDDLCVGLRNGVKEGSRLDVVKCDKHNAEQCWNLKQRKNGDKTDYFRMHPCHDEDLCVQISGADQKDKLKLRPCKHDDGRQYFSYDDNEDDEVTPKTNTKLCMAPKKIKKDRAIWLRRCNGKDEQSWKTRAFKGDSNCEDKCSSLSDEKFKWCKNAPDKQKHYWLEEYGAYHCAEFKNKWEDVCIMRECDGFGCKKDRDCGSSARPFCAKSLGICVECMQEVGRLCEDETGDAYCALPGEVDDVQKYYTCQD